MLFGSFLGLLWAAFAQAGLRERVGSYEGQRVVQVDMTWGEGRSYHLYPYHGPLVPGQRDSSVQPRALFCRQSRDGRPIAGGYICKGKMADGI